MVLIGFCSLSCSIYIKLEMYLIFTIMYDIISGIISPINLKMNRVSLNLTCLLTNVYYIVRATFSKLRLSCP